MAAERGGHTPDSPPPPEALASDEAAALLETARPRLAVGAVYQVPDAWTQRTESAKIRPVMVTGAIPALDPVEVALRRPIRIVTRVSWKQHLGPPPRTPAECDLWRLKMGWIFTPAGLLPAFDRDGIFELRPLRIIRLELLVRARFLGWLPQDYAALVGACATGARLPDPYPPRDE